MLAEAVAEIEAATAVDARLRVRSMMAEDAFGGHAAALTSGDWPVAVLGPSGAGNLGSTATAVRLSDWTAAKQLYPHPGLRPADYARVQRILDGGRLLRESDRVAVAFLFENWAWWRAVLKATADEIYLLSYHRVEQRHLERAERELSAL